jgi:hypothetical protein
MTQLNLYSFAPRTKGEGAIDVNTMLNINFEIIRQIINAQDAKVSQLESNLVDPQP